MSMGGPAAQRHPWRFPLSRISRQRKCVRPGHLFANHNRVDIAFLGFEYFYLMRNVSLLRLDRADFSMIPQDSPSSYDSMMGNLIVLFIL
jgi:hypothetical protein